MQTDLSGKVVVISGAARGIGAATARAFSREAAWVVIVDRDVQAGKMLERTIGKAQFIAWPPSRWGGVSSFDPQQG